MSFIMPENVKFINTLHERGKILTDNPIFAVTNNRTRQWQKARYRKK